MQPMIPELKKDFFPRLKNYHRLEETVHFIVQDRFHFLAQNAELIKILVQECLVNTELREALLVNIQMSILTDFTDYWQLLKSKNPQINSNLSGMDVIRTNAGLLFAYFIFKPFIYCLISLIHIEIVYILIAILLRFCDVF